MSFGTRHLLLGLLLAATAGAEPTTQPDAPPVIRGEVIGTAFRAEEVNLAVRSVRHQLVYEIVDGELTPAEQGPVPAKLHCEVSLPPLLTQMATYRSEPPSLTSCLTSTGSMTVALCAARGAALRARIGRSKASNGRTSA